MQMVPQPELTATAIGGWCRTARPQAQGVVSWVGRSSIEVQATVVCEGSPALTATFVMVAKDPHTGKTIEINRLKLVTPEDEQRWASPLRDRVSRQRGAVDHVAWLCLRLCGAGGRTASSGWPHASASEMTTCSCHRRTTTRFAPTVPSMVVRGGTAVVHTCAVTRLLLCAQVGLLHDMLLSIAGGPTTGTGWGGGVPAADDVPAPASGAVDSVRMADTRIWGSRLMQPQEMNSSNNIFGGA